MYGQTAGVAGLASTVGATAAGATGATLPFTGLNLIWIVLAAFAVYAAGLAILRVVPRVHA